MTVSRKHVTYVAALFLAFAASWIILPSFANGLFYDATGKPRLLGKVANRQQAGWSALGLPPSWGVNFEVPGRASGKLHSLPLVVADYEGERYLVAMMGNRSDWVLNVRANGGRAIIQHGRRQPVVLEDVPVESRAPILKAYLKRAPGARPHFAIGPDAPLQAFEEIAADYPVMLVRPA